MFPAAASLHFELFELPFYGRGKFERVNAFTFSEQACERWRDPSGLGELVELVELVTAAIENHPDMLSADVGLLLQSRQLTKRGHRAMSGAVDRAH